MKGYRVMTAVCGRTISTGTVSFAMAAALLASASLFFSPASAGPIHDVTRADDAAQVEQLIAAGTDVDDSDAAKKTALYWAVELGHTEVAELLVANGADVNAQDFADSSPLHAAGDLDREAIADLLIATGAETPWTRTACRCWICPS
jgi:uncharacterized protein